MIGREKTCYAVSVTEADAVSAREACQAAGADLVWMDTAEEQTWLIGVVRKAFQDLKFKHWHIGESQGQIPLWLTLRTQSTQAFTRVRRPDTRAPQEWWSIEMDNLNTWSRSCFWQVLWHSWEVTSTLHGAEVGRSWIPTPPKDMTRI